MRHLVNISVYAFNKSYDYQSVCEPGAAPKQGAGPRSAYVVSNVPSSVPASEHSVSAPVTTVQFSLLAIHSRRVTHRLVGHCCRLVSHCRSFTAHEKGVVK